MVGYILEIISDFFLVIPFSFLLRILLAAFLGAVIGIEREISDKPAGLRTNILICVGAALFTEISLTVGAQYADLEFANSDAQRIAAQVVSGIGFLGAGTIIQSKGSVIGLTTAATMWVVAAIGMAVGIQAYMFAVGVTFLVLLALIPLRKVENIFLNQSTYWFEVKIEDGVEFVEEIDSTIKDVGVYAYRTSLHRDPSGKKLTISYDTNGPKYKFDQLQTDLMQLQGVAGINIHHK